MVPEAIRRWREQLQWTPIDLPDKLEIGPIQAQVVPFWLFYATIEMNVTGKVVVTVNGKQEEELKEICNLRDELNEILVCATTDAPPALLDELFEAKAFLPPLTQAQKMTTQPAPAVPRHPFHVIRYRDHLNTFDETDAKVLRPDIPPQKADEMIQDWLINQAGPFLAEQQFKVSFGADAKEIHSSTSLRGLVRHLLQLPIYSTYYTYHNTQYPIIVSGINGHVAAPRMAYGSGSLGRAISSFTAGVSRLVSNNL